MRLAAEHGIDPALMHRVAAIGSGTLDSLPHNGAVVTLLAVCGSTHGKSYLDILMVAIVGAAPGARRGDRPGHGARLVLRRRHGEQGGPSRPRFRSAPRDERSNVDFTGRVTQSLDSPSPTEHAGRGRA